MPIVNNSAISVLRLPIVVRVVVTLMLMCLPLVEAEQCRMGFVLRVCCQHWHLFR